MNARLNALTVKHTSFASFEAMINALGGYRPSFYLRNKSAADQNEVRELAEAYDAAQEARGDERRAYRGDFNMVEAEAAAVEVKVEEKTEAKVEVEDSKEYAIEVKVQFPNWTWRKGWNRVDFTVPAKSKGEAVKKAHLKLYGEFGARDYGMHWVRAVEV